MKSLKNDFTQKVDIMSGNRQISVGKIVYGELAIGGIIGVPK